VAIEIVTKEDFQIFRMQLLADIKAILAAHTAEPKAALEGYKTKDVRRILGCCYNTLKSLRISRKIRTKKVGGTIYYNKEDVRRLVEEGFGVSRSGE
jgi:hypothetical protein